MSQMTRTCLLGWLGMALLAGYAKIGWSQVVAAGQVTVLKGATIIDGTGKEPMPYGVIVIEGEKSKALGGTKNAKSCESNTNDALGKINNHGLTEAAESYAAE